MPVLLPAAVTTKKLLRHCQPSPGRQNHLQLRATETPLHFCVLYKQLFSPTHEYPFLLLAERDRERWFSCLEKPHAAWEAGALQGAYILLLMGSRSETSSEAWFHGKPMQRAKCTVATQPSHSPGFSSFPLSMLSIKSWRQEMWWVQMVQCQTYCIQTPRSPLSTGVHLTMWKSTHQEVCLLKNALTGNCGHKTLHPSGKS